MELEVSEGKSSIYELVTETNEYCEICMNTRECEKHLILKCGHALCSLCLTDYYNSLKSNGRLFPFVCPVEDCGKDVHSSLRAILDSTEMKSFRRLMKRFNLLRDNKVVWCQVINCDGYGVIEGNEVIKCNQCEIEINSTLNPSVSELMSQFSLTQCPGCKALISRTFGCMDLKCYCGTEFCSKCGMINSKHHSKWVCLATDEKQEISNWSILLALLSPVLVPILPVFIVYLYRNHWDKNYIRVLNEFPYFYFLLILIFSPIILVASLFYLPFIWGWYCVDGIFGGKASRYRGLWVLFKALIYFPAVFLTFLGWLLLLSLIISFAPLYGIVLALRKFGVGVKKA